MTMPQAMSKASALVIGTSAGGVDATFQLLPSIPTDCAIPIVIVQHVGEHGDQAIPDVMGRRTNLPVRVPDDKTPIDPGTVYFAPAGYHLLVERDDTFALCVGPRVRFSRPSINVTFESAAAHYRTSLVGIVLTGANDDGALGLQRIHALGGHAIVQDPNEASSHRMPEAALVRVPSAAVLTLQEIGDLLSHLPTRNAGSRPG